MLHAILEHVFQSLGRPGHVARKTRVAFVVDLASHAAQVERGGERLHGPGHHLARLDAGRLHRDGPGVCLCKLEQGAYQPAHALDHPLELAQGTRANALVVGLLRHGQGEPHGRERGAYLVRHVGQGMRQVGLLPAQACRLFAQGIYHLCQLVLEDGQVAFAIIGQVDGTARPQHLVYLARQMRHLAIALLGDDRKEDDARRPRNPRPYGGGVARGRPGGHSDDGHAGALEQKTLYKRGVVQGLHGQGLSSTGKQGGGGVSGCGHGGWGEDEMPGQTDPAYPCARYPKPRTVWMSTGLAGSSSTLSRRRLI